MICPKRVKGVTNMLRKLSLIAIGLAMLSLAACSTVKGAGRDLQDASDATRDAMTD